MAAWSIALKALIKWGPVVFAAGRKAMPYLRDNPAAQRFVQSMADQTAALWDELLGLPARRATAPPAADEPIRLEASR